MTAELARSKELWIDTEVADWQTKAPRLSLIQIRAGDTVHVIDVLREGMANILQNEFIPRVMASPAIRKWAHSARFERRFLGGSEVRELRCTLELARSIPYHRLPLRSLSLAALVKHFFGRTIDKTLQRSDWGVRPLTVDQVRYAAADPEWCYRIQQSLEKVVLCLDPEREDPVVIRERYLTILSPLKMVEGLRKRIRVSVQALMERLAIEVFASFTLRRRLAQTTFLSELIRLALEADPGRRFDLTFRVTKKLRDFLADEQLIEAVRAVCKIEQAQSFRGPRLTLKPQASPEPYELAPDDPERVNADYAVIEEQRRKLLSEKAELRDRMKSWLTYRQLERWKDFAYSAPEERWYADVRDLSPFRPRVEYEVSLPARFLLAFANEHLETLKASTQCSAVLTWREHRSIGADADDVQETRDWQEETSQED